MAEQSEVTRGEQPEHWGKALIALLDSLDMSDWEAMQIDDPVEWVRQIRREQTYRLKPYWDGEK